MKILALGLAVFSELENHYTVKGFSGWAVFYAGAD